MSPLRELRLNPGEGYLMRYGALAVLLWTLLVGLLAAVILYEHRQMSLGVAGHVAETYLKNDMALRFWAARHGGVYVPSSDWSPPNPYLATAPERDIVTPSGRRLTLVNPAYLMRQVTEYRIADPTVNSHLTSLKPLRPENAPDPWERSALVAFEQGVSEVREVEVREGVRHLRLMRPLLTRQACLKCHAEQGYEVGDVRGGLSVTLDLEPFEEHFAIQEWSMLLVHLGFWLAGFLTIALSVYWMGASGRERRQRRLELQQAHHFNRLVLQSVGQGLYGVDREGKLSFLNPAGEALLGWKEAELLGKPIHEVIHHTHADGMEYPQRDCPLLGAMEEGRALTGEDDVFVRRDGSFIPVTYVSTPIRDGQNITGSVMAFQDISERLRNEERIRHLAHHDFLTELPNRVLLLEMLEQAVAQARRYEQSLAVLFLDLDNFSVINDTVGHVEGDALLIQVANRLRAVIRKPDLLTRPGGDEFIVLLYNPAGGGNAQPEIGQDPILNHAQLVAERLLAALVEPFHIAGQELSISTSIGFSLFPEDAEDAAALLKHADSAMYEAKDRGKGGISRFGSGQSQAQERRNALQLSLSTALEQRELEVYYQPQVDLVGGATVGFEALLRWKSDRFGQVSPAEFIPIAEASGLIVSIGEWVLEQSGREVKKWRDMGAEVYVAVNVSLRQILRGHLDERVAAIASGCGVSNSAFELEVTEVATAYDPDQARQVFLSLHEQGLALALDDFGTGYSSLTRLKHLPIRTLKIDKSFVDGVPDYDSDVQIVRSTIQLAKGLGMHSLAEGIETEVQSRFLLAQGCELGQGYYFARPMPAEDARAYLRAELDAA